LIAEEDKVVDNPVPQPHGCEDCRDDTIARLTWPKKQAESDYPKAISDDLQRPKSMVVAAENIEKFR
jgi:hypothetical protein